MVSAHGALSFDHAGYQRMATQGTMVITGFKLHEIECLQPNDGLAILMYKVDQTVAPRAGGEETTQHMIDTSTWAKIDGNWKCVDHTETETQSAQS